MLGMVSSNGRCWVGSCASWYGSHLSPSRSKGMSVEEQRSKNQESLDAMSERIGSGAFTALFPEGVSHDDPVSNN